ncbi:MBL fold metallo-hydrolase [Chloroflexota bacterium]
MEKITDNVYAETGFRGCNCGFVVTKEGVVMLDTPQMPTDAIKWRDEINKHGTVRYLINTEPHGDHFTGNHFFEGTVVAHEGTREAILAASVEQFKERIQQTDPESLPLMEGFSYRPPAITFSQRLTLYVGDHTFQLIHLPGHSPFQVAVYIPEERVAFTSDNIFHKVQPYLHQSLPYKWLDSLKITGALETDILVPGHGSICNRSYIPEMSAIVQAWIDAVSAAMNQGLSVDEAHAKIVEEAQDKLSKIGCYNKEGTDSVDNALLRMNVVRLYEVLKK